MFGDRYARSLAVAKQSYKVLKTNPTLMIFPILSGVSTLMASIPLFLMLMAAYGVGTATKSQAVMDVAHYAVMGVTYFVNYFIVIFFNSALVACANESLQGRPTSVRFGLEAAASRLPQILGWTVIASTVGIILRTIGERGGVVGAIVTSIIGLAWNLVVFFVIPILILERTGPITAVKESTAMLKKTWGEKLILGLGIGLAMFVVGLILVIPFILAIGFAVNSLWIGAILALLVTIVGFIGLAIVSSALTAIYQTSLYLYARTGSTTGGFTADQLTGAFAPKPPSKFFGR